MGSLMASFFEFFCLRPNWFELGQVLTATFLFGQVKLQFGAVRGKGRCNVGRFLAIANQTGPQCYLRWYLHEISHGFERKEE